jgi:site-specific DNA-methyltransferase (adenine-specific)
MMARNGSFPLSVAQNLLRRYARPGNVVLDPFCGKGTSLLAARSLGCSAFGLDVAPEAVATASAKLQNVALQDVLDYLRNLRLQKRSLHPIPPEIHTFFHRDTLAQLLTIRDTVIADANSSNVVKRGCAIVTLGLLLGVLHGHASYSLSISSAHAYSMAPAYVARFAKQKGLVPPLRDVRDCLIAKALTTVPPTSGYCVGDVRLGSALNSHDVFPDLRSAVDVMLTSPPYLDRQTYAKDNWLRLWLLGYSYKLLKPTYLETGSVARYTTAMRAFFLSSAKLLRPDGFLICIAGDVRRRRGANVEYFETGTLLAEICQHTGLFSIRTRETHDVRANSTYLHALSKTLGHTKRNLTERIFVAQRNSET